MTGLLSLNVVLIHTDGELMKRHTMNLALHASCILFVDGARGYGTVAEPERGFVDFELGDRDSRDLCRAAEEAGFADRAPQVQEVADTSDRSAFVSLQVSHEKGSRDLMLNLMCSGYEGPDAPALKRFLALLLKHAGVRDESILGDLTGERRLP